MEFVQDTREHLGFDWNDDSGSHVGADVGADVGFDRENYDDDVFDTIDDIDVTRSLWTNTYANTHANEWFMDPDDADQDTIDPETFHMTITRVLDRLYPTDSPSDTIDDN